VKEVLVKLGLKMFPIANSSFFRPTFHAFPNQSSLSSAQPTQYDAASSMKWNKMSFQPSTFAMSMLHQRIIIIFMLLLPLTSVIASEPCRFSFPDGDRLYNYTLSSPIRNFPHGILSEDGYSLSFSSWSCLNPLYIYFFCCVDLTMFRLFFFFIRFDIVFPVKMYTLSFH